MSRRDGRRASSPGRCCWRRCCSSWSTCPTGSASRGAKGNNVTDTAHPRRGAASGGTMGKWVKEHGLLLANIGLFVVFFGGMVFSGAAEYSQDQLTHGGSAVTVLQYLG